MTSQFLGCQFESGWKSDPLSLFPAWAHVCLSHAFASMMFGFLRLSSSLHLSPSNIAVLASHLHPTCERVSVRWWTRVDVMNSRMYTRKQLDVNCRSSSWPSSIFQSKQKVLCKMALVDLQWPSNVFTCIMNRNGSIMQESLQNPWFPCDTLKDFAKSFATAKDFDFATVSFYMLFELVSPDHSRRFGFYW